MERSAPLDSDENVQYRVGAPEVRTTMLPKSSCKDY